MNRLKVLMKFVVLVPMLLFIPVSVENTANAALYAPLIQASEHLPFNSQLKKLIRDTFYKDGRPCPEKIARYRALIEQRYNEVRGNLKHFYVLEKDTSNKKAGKKIEKKDECRAYEILLDYISQLEHQDDTIKFQFLALKIFRLDYALKIQARKLASVELIEKIPFSLRPKKIPIHKTPRGEASNLVNPETGLFYSQAELQALKKQGGDVSKLNPPSDGSFWIDLDVSRIDVADYYHSGKDPLHNGLGIIFPANTVYFDKIRKTQSKPKVDVFIDHNGQKVEYKLKIGAEVYSETTCAALMTALGFSADISEYVKDFKVVLGKVTYNDFYREWKSYYGGYDPERYIKEKGKDEQGNYIIFHEGVLESKPSGLLRVGRWAYGGNGNGGLREVRALLLFNMWVSNLDLKESENNKLILRKFGDEQKFFHIQHDMGFSFGKTYMERPGMFQWNLVKKKTDHYIHMNFSCLVDNSLFDYVTYADARWMARLIARLTRKQITDAVILGGWPEPLQKLLVEKLIARRNQLVNAFGLTGEKTPEGDTITSLKYDRYLTTADGVVENGKLKVYRFEGYPQYFGPRVNEILALILKGLRNGAVDTVVNFLSTVKYIVIKPEDFGLDRRIVSKIIIRTNREIEQNPYPADVSESFLVKDSMEIGLRLGYGTVVSGDIAYARKYTLVYPVETRDEGRFHDKFILNVFLPFKNRGRNLPPNHVVMLEDYLEGRGKFRLRTDPEIVQVECALSASKIYLNRRFIGFKDNLHSNRAVFFEDNSLYNELRFRVFLDFLRVFRSTPFNASVQKGILNRDYVEMDTSDLRSNPGKQEALEQLLMYGDPTLVKKTGQTKYFRDRFTEKKKHIKFLGLLKRKSVFRVDRIEETNQHSSLNKTNQDRIQVESRKLKSWRFFDNGERHLSNIRLTGKAADGNAETEQIHFSFQVNDRSTHDGELKNGYLNFINTLALKDNFIPFDSTLHTTNRLWGHTQTFVNIILYPEAIEELINAGETRIWEALADVTGNPADYWRRESRPNYSRGRPVIRRYSHDRYLAVKTDYFIRELRRARACDGLKRMRRVVNACRKASYTSGQSFEPALLAVIHKLVGKDNIYIDALVTMPANKEQLFPARAPLYNELGIDREIKIPIFQFIFDDPSEIYYFF